MFYKGREIKMRQSRKGRIFSKGVLDGVKAVCMHITEGVARADPSSRYIARDLVILRALTTGFYTSEKDKLHLWRVRYCFA
jgi:hypothetical protein